jgi:hypothetical protein
MRDRYVGLSERQNTANILEGSIQLQDGTLLDLNQILVGSGFVTATLNREQTRDANTNSKNVGDIVDAVIERLEARGYVSITGEEPAPI